MPILLIVLGTGALAWLLKETDYIIPVTAALVLMLIVTAVNPGVAVFMLMAMAAIIVVSIIIAFLPQVLGFMLGALLLVVCIIMAGAAAHAESYLEVKQGINTMQKMDADTCNEVEGDEIENIYNDQNGWKLKLGGKIPGGWHDSVTKGNRTITFTCQNGYFIRSEGSKPIMDGQVEYMK